MSQIWLPLRANAQWSFLVGYIRRFAKYRTDSQLLSLIGFENLGRNSQRISEICLVHQTSPWSQDGIGEWGPPWIPSEHGVSAWDRRSQSLPVIATHSIGEDLFMLSVGIDQHRKQLTAHVRDDQGEVVLHRRVSAQWVSAGFQNRPGRGA
jgi:hypothetical protein